MWDHEILYAGRSLEDEQHLIRPLLGKNQKYKHGRQLKFKIHILFYGDIVLYCMKLGRMKDHGHTRKFCFNIVLFYGAFECDDGTFQLLR
jgi:hypothetical protein